MAAKKKTSKKAVAVPARRYGLICFYVGVALIVVSLCINFIFLRPTDFKNQFREHQLADCLNTTTSVSSCYEHFGKEQ
ncbi:MAG: hypothetical protein AAB436_00785 [Patescibacteria group bacterium]